MNAESDGAPLPEPDSKYSDDGIKGEDTSSGERILKPWDPAQIWITTYRRWCGQCARWPRTRYPSRALRWYDDQCLTRCWERPPFVAGLSARSSSGVRSTASSSSPNPCPPSTSGQAMRFRGSGENRGDLTSFS